MTTVDYKCPVCQKVAFRFNGMPYMGQPMRAQDAILLDGSQPKPGDEILCGACNRHLGRLYVQHLTP